MQRKKLLTHIPVILIFLITAFFRFAYLDRIPGAASGDELLYPITAKAVSLTGHDITGTWNPLSALIFRYPPNEQQAELPYFLQLLTAPFTFSLFVMKIPFALFSVGIVILLYLIAKKLFGESTGIATAFMAAINPWFVVMGRTGYESTPATFFYLLGLYMLTRLRSRQILWSLLPFILAFYSYIGTKLIFLPFVILASYLGFSLNKGQYKKQYIILVGLATIFVILFVALLKTNPSSRLGDLLTPNSQAVTEQVNALRKSSLRSSITPLLVNRYVVYAQTIFAKIFRVFSPQYLFVDGDQFFLPVSQGFFHYLDAIFILIGSLALFNRKRIYAIIIFLFVFIGALPQIFHRIPSDFSIHLTLMFPFLVLLTGVGIAHMLSSLPKKYFILGIFITILLYAGNVGGFVNAYFYRYPLVGSQDFPMRELARYLSLVRATRAPVTVYSNRKGDFLKKYLFYTNSMTPVTMPAITAIDTRSPFTFLGIRFTDCDTSVRSPDPERVTVYDSTCGMHIPGTNESIARLTDGGSVYTIVNDPLCKNMELREYPTGITLTDLNVEHLTAEQFCTTYISR